MRPDLVNAKCIITGVFNGFSYSVWQKGDQYFGQVDKGYSVWTSDPQDSAKAAVNAALEQAQQ